MKRIYWILTSISLYSLLSCSNGAKDTREYQTVKTDTVVSAGGQTSLQYPGKVKAAQDISLAFRVSGTIHTHRQFLHKKVTKPHVLSRYAPTKGKPEAKCQTHADRNVSDSVPYTTPKAGRD